MRSFSISPAHMVLTQKGWQAVSGLITALLVTVFLTPLEQGYYYAFASLLSGYVLLDLGLSALLVQVSARLFHGLSLSANGEVTAHGNKRDDYLALIRWSTVWFRYIGLFALALLPIGYLYFTSTESTQNAVQWQLPWLLIVLAVAFSVQAYPVLAVIEGTGRVTETYSVRLLHYLIGGVFAWILLAAGFGLYALAMAPLAVAASVSIWKRIRYRELFAGAMSCEKAFDWRQHIWPMQSRVAISWFANYVFIYSPTLIVFYFGDPALAGRLGLSVVVANLVSSMSASWLTAKVPAITQLAVAGDLDESRRLFVKEFARALGISTLLYASGIIFAILIAGYQFADRILAPVELAILFVSFTAYFSLSIFVIYFRAQGREVLAPVALLASLSAMILSIFVIDAYGIVGVLTCYLSIYGSATTVGMIYWWRRQHQR